MSRRQPTVDVEAIQTTKSEKLLAVVLAVFLLIGGVWTYHKLDEWARSAVTASVSPDDRAVVDRLQTAENRDAAADEDVRIALDELVLAREAYRTALDANRPADTLRRAYEARQREHALAKEEARAAARAVASLRTSATAAATRIAQEEERARDREALLSFVARLGLVAAALAASFWLLARLRRSASRWFPLAFSAVGSATVLALVLAGDYVTDYVDPLDLGPLVLSLVGVAVTLVGFAVLQRYLARRIPAHRVRKGECPFCGYPVGDGTHCEGCGREVVAPCASCASPRRVGTLHCRACGEA